MRTLWIPQSGVTAIAERPHSLAATVALALAASGLLWLAILAVLQAMV